MVVARASSGTERWTMGPLHPMGLVATELLGAATEVAGGESLLG